MTSAPTSASQAQGDRPPRSFAEWVTFSIALTILAAIIGVILYDWIATPQTPPVVQVTQGSVRAENGQFYVPFTLENSGGGTAESVQVVAELEVDGDVVEEGDQQIDFLSGGETAEGAFVFSQDPQSGTLTVRVASYQMP